jgi:hypothetical protein
MHMWALRIFLVLLVGSVPFVIESSLEAYVVTLFSGPQMLFFSISHGAPPLILICLLLSAASLVLATLSGLIFIIARRLGSLGPPFPGAIVAIVTAVLIFHVTLLTSYQWWSATALSREICVVALAGFPAALFAIKRSASNNRLERSRVASSVSKGGNG